MQTNQDIFSKAYTEQFKLCYPKIKNEQAQDLIIKALRVALNNINNVHIDSPAFLATTKALGIKHTYRAIKDYLAGVQR